MNLRRHGSVLVMTAAGLSLAAGMLLQPVFAQQGPPPAGAPGERGPRGPGGAGGEPSVSRSMKGMGRALKTLKEQVTDPAKKADNLKLVGDVQRGCVTAKNMPVPEDLLAGASEEEKAKKAEAYRRQLIGVLRAAIDLETAILDGKTDLAQEKITAIIGLRNKAHEEFGVEED